MEFDSLFDGKYKVLKLIGAGGCGRVYLAENVRTKSLWAIKEILYDGADFRQIEREIDILKKIRHPALPRIVDVLREDGMIYLIEDYFEGHNIEDILRQKNYVDIVTAIRWACEICDIMIFLHGQLPDPIIYRDLKPSNIILSPEGEIRLVDFGSVRHYQADSPSDTVYIGTRGYAAPEQYGLGQTSVQTDIYSFGVTMFQIITGKRPTAGPIGWWGDSGGRSNNSGGGRSNNSGGGRGDSSGSCGSGSYRGSSSSNDRSNNSGSGGSGGSGSYRDSSSSNDRSNRDGRGSEYAGKYEYSADSSTDYNTIRPIPKPLMSILNRCIEYNPTNRYNSFVEIKHDLRSLIFSNMTNMDDVTPDSQPNTDGVIGSEEPISCGGDLGLDDGAGVGRGSRLCGDSTSGDGSSLCDDSSLSDGSSLCGDSSLSDGLGLGDSTGINDGLGLNNGTGLNEGMGLGDGWILGDASGLDGGSRFGNGSVDDSKMQSDYCDREEVMMLQPLGVYRCVTISVTQNHEFAFEFANHISARYGLKTLILDCDFESTLSELYFMNNLSNERPFENNSLYHAVSIIEQTVSSERLEYMNGNSQRNKRSDNVSLQASACINESILSGFDKFARMKLSSNSQPEPVWLNEPDPEFSGFVAEKLIRNRGIALRRLLTEITVYADVCIILTSQTIFSDLNMRCFQNSHYILCPGRAETPAIKSFNNTALLAGRFKGVPTDRFKYILWEYGLNGINPDVVWSLADESLAGVVHWSKRRDGARRGGVRREGVYNSCYAYSMEKTIKKDYDKIINALGIIR